MRLIDTALLYAWLQWCNGLLRLATFLLFAANKTVAPAERKRPSNVGLWLADEILQKGRRRNGPLRIGDRFQRRGQRQADGVVVDPLQAVAVATEHAGSLDERSRARE